MPSLDQLPAEVLCRIADMSTWEKHWNFLDFGRPSYARDHAALARTSRRLHIILNRSLYKRNIERDAVLNSCMLWAAQNGRLGTIQTAMALGADPDVILGRDIKALGWNRVPGRLQFAATPLHLAAQHGHSDIVKYLLQNGAGVHVSAEKLCNCGRSNHDYSPPYALHTAIFHGDNADCVELLIQHGAYLLNANQLALDRASSPQCVPFVPMLLQQRPLSSQPRSAQISAASLQYALKINDLQLVQEILAREELDASTIIKGQSPLEVAVKGGNTDAIKLLLERPEIDPNTKDSKGITALHIAASQGDAEVINILLTAKPDLDINATDAMGMAPIHLAAAEGHANALNILANCPGIKINTRSADGQLPLHVAASSGNYCSVRMLLQRPEVQISATDNNQYNVLHHLATFRIHDKDDFSSDSEDEVDSDEMEDAGHEEYRDLADDAKEFIKELVGLGIDINGQSSSLETPFRLAISHLNFHFALALLACGCDPTIGFEGNSGWTTLHDCLRCSMNEETQTKLVTQLVSRGVGIDMRLESGDEIDVSGNYEEGIEINLGGTPLYFAAGFARNLSSMKVLLDAGANPNQHIPNFCEPGADGYQMKPILVGLQFEYSYHGRSSNGAIPLLVEYGARLDDTAGGDESALSSACDGYGGADIEEIKDLLQNATSDSISCEYLQTLIDKLGDGVGVESTQRRRDALRLLTEFRDRTF